MATGHDSSMESAKFQSLRIDFHIDNTTVKTYAIPDAVQNTMIIGLKERFFDENDDVSLTASLQDWIVRDSQVTMNDQSLLDNYIPEGHIYDEEEPFIIDVHAALTNELKMTQNS